MGDDAASAELDLFPPRRGRPVEPTENRSWRTNSAARHVSSTALVISPAESTEHTERKGTSAKLLSAAPLWASFLGFYAAVFPHSGGPETRGDEIVGRQCYLSRVGSVFAPPESTCRAEKEPTTADRWQCRLGFLSAGVDCPYGELPSFRTQRRFGRVSSEFYAAVFPHSGGTETRAAK